MTDAFILEASARHSGATAVPFINCGPAICLA